jgi:hypothetical protein
MEGISLKNYRMKIEKEPNHMDVVWKRPLSYKHKGWSTWNEGRNIEDSTVFRDQISEVILANFPFCA